MNESNSILKLKTSYQEYESITDLSHRRDGSQTSIRSRAASCEVTCQIWPLGVICWLRTHASQSESRIFCVSSGWCPASLRMVQCRGSQRRTRREHKKMKRGNLWVSFAPCVTGDCMNQTLSFYRPYCSHQVFEAFTILSK